VPSSTAKPLKSKTRLENSFLLLSFLPPNTRKSSLFILHSQSLFFLWKRRKNKNEHFYDAFAILLQLLLVKLYFIHSSSSFSCQNVIDDSRLSRVCLLNLLFHLSFFTYSFILSNATSLQLRRDLAL
jgi:hypothetical protein